MDDTKRVKDWTYWNALDALEVWEAVALSLDLAPGMVPRTFVHKISQHPGSNQVWVGLQPTQAADPDLPIYIDVEGGPEFRCRLAVVMRSFDVVPAPIASADPTRPQPSEPDRARYKVLSASVRDYLVQRGYSIPKEWTTPTTATNAAKPDDDTQPDDNAEWIGYARQLAFDLRARHHKWNRTRLSEEIHKRFIAENITTRRGDVPSAGYIERWALRKLPKVPPAK